MRNYNMRKFIINKPIMLNFLTFNDSHEYLIDPKENTLVIVEGCTVFYLCDGVKRETINTVGVVNGYIKDGSLKESLSVVETFKMHPDDYKIFSKNLDEPPREPNDAMRKALDTFSNNNDKGFYDI